MQAGRELFNERGEANVTMAHIGERLGMSEGNVWYHFHTKHDLVLAIFIELQDQIALIQQGIRDDLVRADHLEGLLARGFQLMWAYRFLLRDHINWANDQAAVATQIAAMAAGGRAFVMSALEHLATVGLLAIPPEQISPLATNVWIVVRYWVDYCQARSNQQHITERDIEEGVAQARALLSPYLSAHGRQLLEEAHQ